MEAGVFEEAVEEEDELSHGGGQGDLGLFAGPLALDAAAATLLCDLRFAARTIIS